MPVRNSLLKPEDELVGEKVAAVILGIYNYKTLSNWRSDGRNPDLPYVRIGRSIRYRVGDLIEFRQRHTVGGVKAVEPVIEQVAPAISTPVKAPISYPQNAPVAIEVAYVASTAPKPSHHASTQSTAPVQFFRPSDLVRSNQTESPRVSRRPVGLSHSVVAV